MTPIEAKTRTCPVARIQGDADSSGNTIPTCRADGCMWWRWIPLSADVLKEAVAMEMRRLATEAGKPFSPTYHKQAVANVTNDPSPHGLNLEPTDGYCGAAGAP